MKENRAEFRFYQELNDFFPQEKKHKVLGYAFNGNPGIKDSIEALGVPHTEIDLILVNGESVSFSYQLKNRDRVSVYPVFESLDISGLTRLRERPLRESRFILDVHLGKLARYLRMFGFDCLYDNRFEDQHLAAVAERENRIILTRDIGLLKRRNVTHGYWVRSLHPRVQLEEVFQRFDLYSQIRPFSRCKSCNTALRRIEKEKIIHRLKPKTRTYYSEFFICDVCDKLYWKGSHYQSMKRRVFSGEHYA
jgi:uncharacterized protein with PIN domain